MRVDRRHSPAKKVSWWAHVRFWLWRLFHGR
jgi:hypothetical protein